MESELHAVLKELIRLHGKAAQPNQAALFKQLFRLALTQREVFGTALLAHVAAEWKARQAQVRPGT